MKNTIEGKSNFYYDKEFQCLVQVFNGKEKARISLNKSDLDQLQFDLYVILQKWSENVESIYV